MQRVWIIYAEVGPHPDHPNGAFVECYVPRYHITDAVNAALSALHAQGSDVRDVTRAILFEPDEWDDENDSDEEVRKTVSMAAKSSEIQWGVFRTWETDEG